MEQQLENLHNDRGSPIELPLALIDEDPKQPRTRFNQASLEELAQTITQRGVKTPISVRPNPDFSGRYIINHGARRYRASMLVGNTHIPAFIDRDYTEEDQIIENLQRDELSAREIAEFVGRLLAQGKKKSEIARTIGKSPAYVTQHVALLELPDVLAKAYDTGRCADVTVLNELATAYKRQPELTTAWLEDVDQEITRSSVRLLRDFLGTQQKLVPVKKSEKTEIVHSNSPEIMRRPRIQVSIQGRTAYLLFDRRPSAANLAWFQCAETNEIFEEVVTDVRLLALFDAFKS